MASAERVRRLLFTRAVCVPCAARESQDTSKAARLKSYFHASILLPLASETQLDAFDR